MARYDYHSSSAGPIDTSGIKNLGTIAQNAMDLVFQQQQDDARMNQMRQEAATQARQRQQALDQQQAADQHQMAVERQNRIMQLAQLAKNGKSFESMAKYLMPDIDPTELQFGVTFADESSRALKEQQDKADKAKQEQINRQLLMQGGGLQALAATDPNARIPGPVSFGMPSQGALTGLGMRPAPPPLPMVSPVENAAGLAGVNPGVLNTVVSGERSRQAQKRADDAAKEAARNARAAARGASSDPYAAAVAREQAKRDVANAEMEGNPDYGTLIKYHNNPSVVRKVLQGKVGAFHDPLVPEYAVREGYAAELTKANARASALKLLSKLDALTEIVSEAGAGGPARETANDLGRRIGKSSEVLGAYQVIQDLFGQLRVNAVTGAAFPQQQLEWILRSGNQISELTPNNMRAVNIRLRAMKDGLMAEYGTGIPARARKMADRALRRERRVTETDWRGQFGMEEKAAPDPDSEWDKAFK